MSCSITPPLNRLVINGIIKSLDRSWRCFRQESQWAEVDPAQDFFDVEFQAPTFNDLNYQKGHKYDGADGANEDEVLFDDALRYAMALDAAGGSAELHVWQGTVHVFPANLGMLRAAPEALDIVGDFLQRTLETRRA